jgi:hypothetical protein
MKRTLVNTISQEIYRRFPEFSGVRPRVREQPQAFSTRIQRQTYLLTYQTNARLANGKSLPRWIRVVADEKGKVLKISTSR